MAGSTIGKRLVISLLSAAAIFGGLAASYVGTAAAWVIFLEILGFLVVAAAAAMACPSLDDVAGPHREARPSEPD